MSVQRKVPAGPPPAKIADVYDEVINPDDWDNEYTGAWIVTLGQIRTYRFLVFAYSVHEAMDDCFTAIHEHAPGWFTKRADVEFDADNDYQPIGYYQVTDTDWFVRDEDIIGMTDYHIWPTDLARYEFISLHCIKEDGSWSVNDAVQRGYVVMPKQPTLSDILKSLKEKEAVKPNTRVTALMLQDDTGEGTYVVQDARKSKDTYGRYEYEFRLVL